MNLEEMFNQIGHKPISLFYGAGVSMDCGGPSGGQLLESMKLEFGDSETDSFFEYMDYIIGDDDSKRAEVEAYMEKQLLSISPEETHKYLFSLPWGAVLTTNYDRLPDLILNSMDSKRTIFPVTDPDSGSIDQTRANLLYCFKLMGDTKSRYPNGGWPVLTSRDLKWVYSRQTQFIELFRNLSSTGHIIYLGYSFDDEIVFDILRDMKHVLKQFPWRGYAITPRKPGEYILKRMEEYGIAWVQGNLKEFIKVSKTHFGSVPTSAPSLIKKFRIHNIPIEIDEATASNIFRRFKILTDADLQSHYDNPREFFKGLDKSFAPYRNNWDYRRRVKVQRLNIDKEQVEGFEFDRFTELGRSGNSSRNIAIALIGSAGSGKTVIAKRLAFDWYKYGNPVIFINTKTISIDTQILESLLDEIWDKYQEKGDEMNQDLKDIRYLLVADDCSNHFGKLVSLRNYLISIGKPVDLLLVSRKSELSLAEIRDKDADVVLEVDDTIHRSELKSLREHFNLFNVLTDDTIVQRNFDDEKINTSFFALVYTSVKGVRKSLDKIIVDEYNSLDIQSQRIYAIIALIQHFSLTPYFTVCFKATDMNPEILLNRIERGDLSGIITHESIFQDEAKPMAQFTRRFVENALYATNRIVADIIYVHALKDIDWLYSALNSVVSVITPGDDVEVELLHSLLIDVVKKRLVQELDDSKRMYLFEHAIDEIPSRPLLQHLGILQMHAGKYEQAASNFERALKASVRGWPGKREHVIDSMARLNLMLAEEAISRKEYETAWSYLDDAERHFRDALITPYETPHPYEGLGKTHIMRANLGKDKETKMHYLLLALRILGYLENNAFDAFDKVESIKSEAISELQRMGLDETTAERITKRLENADGYAFLADYEVEKRNHNKALELVKKGLNKDPHSLWLIRIKSNIIRKQYPEDPAKIRNTLVPYWKSSEFKFDVSLSFQLAVALFKLDNYGEANELFQELYSKSKGALHRLRPLEENRWRENGEPKEFVGIVRKPPRRGSYGKIKCMTLPEYKGLIDVREEDIEFNLRGTDKVTFQIIFNMKGPQASRVRRLE